MPPKARLVCATIFAADRVQFSVRHTRRNILPQPTACELTTLGCPGAESDEFVTHFLASRDRNDLLLAVCESVPFQRMRAPGAK